MPGWFGWRWNCFTVRKNVRPRGRSTNYVEGKCLCDSERRDELEADDPLGQRLEGRNQNTEKTKEKVQTLRTEKMRRKEKE